MTTNVNVPQATAEIEFDQPTFDLAASDGILDVLRADGVDADVDIGDFDRIVLGNLRWGNNQAVFFHGEPAEKIETVIQADEMLGTRTAFERVMRNGLTNTLRRKIGGGVVCTGFAIEAPGGTRLRWNANNDLSLRTGAVSGTYPAE